MRISVLLPEVVRSARGGHKVVYEYCNALVECGHNVNLYFFPGNMFKKYRIPEFIRIPIVKMYGEKIGPNKWFKLSNKIGRHVITDASEIGTADLIIATGIETARPVYQLDKNFGEKIYFIQDFENWSFDDKFVTDSYKLGMKNIVVSRWLQETVDKYATSPSILIQNGIDTSVFNFKQKRRTHHSIAFHYRSAKHKGCEYAIAVIRKLRVLYPDLQVNVVSSEKKPENLPSFCNFYENITAEEVAEINNRSEIFICTSIDEGFGLPGLEAVACGCALVSTRYRGVLEYAVDGENALLSSVRDVDGMVSNVRILFEDESLLKKITTNGIQTGMEHSLDKSKMKFVRTIEEC